MLSIEKHPILNVPAKDLHDFIFEGQKVSGQKGQTIAAALHQAGFIVHSHSLKNRERSLSCGIGKCGACEMLVDGCVRRICITKVDGVKKVERIPNNFLPESEFNAAPKQHTVYKTTVAIVGAGPAGLAVREELNKFSIPNLVLDNNDKIGGQFVMQTHQFFFFEQEKRFGGMRGFDIAKNLAGDDDRGILLNSVVWDILENNRLAVKNIEKQEVFYVDASYLVIATGAFPFVPAFKNGDLPGVYTAAVFQRMMNKEFTLLGKNILTVGAGNIGYLTSYQAFQAGARVKAIIEAMPREGGFPVQANRVRRLGIPILCSHTLLEAIPNSDHTGITGAIVAQCENFRPVAGTEKLIDGIDAINICTGLICDDQLLQKGREVFGLRCHGVGDAIRIGEGTSAVLRGKQCAYEILQQLNVKFPYEQYLSVSKQYADSQQSPVRILETPLRPTGKRLTDKPFVIADCLYGFACNPCIFACKQGAITKSSTSTVPRIDYTRCIGCMDCVSQCPGLAIFGYNLKKQTLFLPIEYEISQGEEVCLVDNRGQKVGKGIVEHISLKENKTHVARVKAMDLEGEALLQVRGFITKENYPEPLELKTADPDPEAQTYICTCEDVSAQDLLKALGDRKVISADELKHITRMGMGPCRGSRCLPRAKQFLHSRGIEVLSEFTPRAPMANQVQLGEIYPPEEHEKIVFLSPAVSEKEESVGAFVAGGGIAGSALMRYLSEAGFKPVMANEQRGSSWRCIAGGRPAFSLPALADIAVHNHEIFKSLAQTGNIDYHLIRYVGFVHNEQTYRSLDACRSWSDAYMIEAKDFTKEISPYMDPRLNLYSHALISNDCWQASPGKTIDLIRGMGVRHGGRILRQCRVLDVYKSGETYHVLVQDADRNYRRFSTPVFINAMGARAAEIAKKMGIETGLYPIRHQAFITRRLPNLGKDGMALDMLIDRRKYKSFSAVYGQQLADTGQIIACASPAVDSQEAGKNLKINTQEFLQIISEMFVQWFPRLSGVGFQAVWSGYYTEPRYIIDPALGLFAGMRGHGFMLSQYLAKLYVDSLIGKPVPDYFKELSMDGNGLSENAFR